MQFPYNFGIINVGAPACGANAAMRAFVRLALTSGYGVMGIHYGFDGLVHDNVRINTNAHTFLKFNFRNTLTSTMLWMICGIFCR